MEIWSTWVKCRTKGKKIKLLFLVRELWKIRRVASLSIMLFSSDVEASRKKHFYEFVSASENKRKNSRSVLSNMTSRSILKIAPRHMGRNKKKAIMCSKWDEPHYYHLLIFSLSFTLTSPRLAFQSFVTSTNLRFNVSVHPNLLSSLLFRRDCKFASLSDHLSCPILICVKGT